MQICGARTRRRALFIDKYIGMAKQTLLEKVSKTEEEAHGIVEQAQRAGKKKLVELTEREEHIVEEIRSKATSRAQSIVREHVEKAETEVNALKQQGESATKHVHQSAESNRETAVAQAMRLFEKDYLDK